MVDLFETASPAGDYVYLLVNMGVLYQILEENSRRNLQFKGSFNCLTINVHSGRESFKLSRPHFVFLSGFFKSA